MANIKTHLNNIKGALYGKDVRGSIHDGIEAINKEVENTTGRQVDLENTFDQLVINAGNSNAEIVDARVKNDGTSYSKLGDRLDAVDSQLEHKTNYVTYEEFGVKSDGVYDDGIAIKEAHKYANKHNLKVIATGKTYYIKETSNIEIETNTDFNGATFIIDDTLDVDRKQGVFTVKSKKDEISIDNISFVINKITKKIDQLKGYGNCFVEVVNENKKQYIRKGVNSNSGEYQRDYFIIDNDGNVLNDIIWDFECVTNIKLYPIDDDFLTICNGNFITKINDKETEYNYFERGIIINRSNVIIDNINHTLENEVAGSPYNGFIHGLKCANVFIKNCILQSHKSYSNSDGVTMGNYDIRFDKVVNIRLDNVIDKYFSSDSWGIFTMNYCKDVIIEKCKLTRIDAHEGVFNIKIRDCVLGHQSIKLIGGGLCEIQNIDILNSDTIVALRPDYGSSWNGDIIIKNVNLKCKEMNYTPKIVDFENDGTHDFGYVCYYPKRLIIEDIFIDDTNILTNGSYTGVCVVYNNSSKTGTLDNSKYRYPYYFSKYIECKNIKTKSGIGCFVFYTDTLNLYSGNDFKYEEVQKLSDNNKKLVIEANTKVIIDNVELVNFSNGGRFWTSNIFKFIENIDVDTDNYLNNTKRVLIDLNIKNCKNVFGFTNDLPLILKLENCTIHVLANKNKSTRMVGGAKDCIFKPKLSAIDTAINPNWLSFSFIDCYFDKVEIGGVEDSNIDNIVKAYPFLRHFKLTNNSYFRAGSKMVNCSIFDIDFNSIDNQIQHCNFKFGNHNFEYYLSSYGYDGEKPKITDCPIPIGFNYWITTQGKFVTWNGVEWI